MPTFIDKASRIEAAGNMPKIIEEYIGRMNTGDQALSIAHMKSPAGWEEPGQKPEFDEYTVVLRGSLHVTTVKESYEVCAGQAIVAHSGEWIRYSTPSGGAEYIAVCVPAFSPDAVNRD